MHVHLVDVQLLMLEQQQIIREQHTVMEESVQLVIMYIRLIASQQPYLHIKIMGNLDTIFITSVHSVDVQAHIKQGQ